MCSTLTRFEYASRSGVGDQARFTNILDACPQLFVLSLGHREGIYDRGFSSKLSPNLLAAIVNVDKLERLHLFCCLGVTWGPDQGFSGLFSKDTLTARDRAQGWMV